MNRNEKIRRLKSMLEQVAVEGELESLIREPESVQNGLESLAPQGNDQTIEDSLRGVRKVAREEELSDSELFGLEAIILPRERPVAFIQNDSFGSLPSPWIHFAGGTIRRRIESVIPSVGRIELPDSPWIPYGGTGFVVGENLLMTNRHVGELFATGLGIKNLSFRQGQSAAIDFKREAASDASVNLRVREIVMIHPHWDMAILRVEGLPENRSPLTLSVLSPEDLNGREIAVIGYPARDERNDLALQDKIFSGVYNVKRMHPGRIRPREMMNSFGHPVNAMTHDSSTLGGNSGSAVLDVESGQIVALHFAGVYLKANYCVPTYELARDSRVVDSGLHFSGSVEPTSEWLAAWRVADPETVDAARPSPKPVVPSPVTSTPPSSPFISNPAMDAPLPVHLQGNQMSMSFSIPLSITVSLGSATPQPSTDPSDSATTEGLKEPFVAGRLNQRKGYQPGFLELSNDEEVPLPTLTVAGKRIAATLDDDSTELKYHKFSVVMHRKRRFALFTAANVDWRKDARLIDGRKPSRKELTGLADGDIEKWFTDPRIAEDHQLPDLFFTKDNAAWDKGHLVRRDDVCWGKTLNDIRKANGDTFHTTNCSPQTAEFNRSTSGEDNWGDLENLIQKQTASEKAIIFSGPVFADDDPVFVGRDNHGEVRVQIPRKYWKIVVAKGSSGPEVFGFVLEQDLSDSELEFSVPESWHAYMSSISEIEDMLNGLVRLTWLKKHDQFELIRVEELPESLRGRRLSRRQEVAADEVEQPLSMAYVETAGDVIGSEVADGFIHGATFQNRHVRFNVLNNRAIFEGDIDLGSLTDISASHEIGLESIGITGAAFRWPNREVPYTIDPSLPNQARVTDAIAHWHSKTQIRFVVRTNQADYVTFRPGGGCSSAVGRQGGQQFVTLGPNCTTGNTIHEIGHAVGLWHEQSREDRDRFVTIDFSNIQSGMEHNFLQHISDGDDLGNYEYGSIMHYPRNAFAKDPTKPTVITPNGEPIGQRTGLSAGDIAGVHAMYP